ncbi:pilus assembly protein PilM [Tepidibacillus marianensis]|uniref:type IV pilus biogenesis protein PilM n=1 Tax=Tepidibacillus marianensis TaxID=3131995 RepID=UPI0030D4C2A7
MAISFDEQVIRFLEVTLNQEKIVEIHQAFSVENKLMDEAGRVDKESWKQFLKETVKPHKIKAKQVHVVIPTSNVIVRQQVMPNLPEKDLKQMIHYEIGSSIHLPFELPVIDVVKVNTGEAVYKEDGEVGSQVVLVAAPGDLIFPIVEGLVDSGFETKSVDIPALSIYRLLKLYHPEQKNEAILLTHITDHGVDLHIFDKGILWFTRHIVIDISQESTIPEAGLDAKALLERIQSQEFYQSFVLDLANEMERAINFFQYTLNNRDQSIKSCWIVSNHLFNEGFYQYLQSRMEIVVTPLPYQSNSTKFTSEDLNGYELGIGALYREVKNNGN